VPRPLSRRTSRGTIVRVSGEGVVSIKPDQFKVNAGVITQASTARGVRPEDVDRRGANALRQLGTNADIKTISYSVT
jgi:uncharacterized protein YggE